MRLTGLRNPCLQLERLHKGLMAATLDRRAKDGSLIRKAGVMAVVEVGGEVLPGDHGCGRATCGHSKSTRPGLIGNADVLVRPFH